MKAYLLAEGSVQGVGYRGFVRHTAQQEGVRGFARNLPGKNQVEIFCICQDAAHLLRFLAAIERKSTSFFGIHVERIHVFNEGKKGFKDFGEIAGFEVRF